MPKAEDRRGLYPPLVVVAGLCFIGSALWLASEIRFRVFQPRAVQQRLFGTQVASWQHLDHASNACCAMDASGILEWAYTIPADQAAKLAKRCLLGNGARRPFTDVNRPYFDEHTKSCVVAQSFDGEAAENASAMVAGTSLRIRLFYDDPDLVDQNFAIQAADR